jgi:uncharacterized membrane protein
MKISQAFRTAIRTVSGRKAETLKFLAVEGALTLMCLAPLLFLTEKGPMRYCAALSAVMWLLIKIPARVNAAAAMQDSLGGGRLFSPGLADPGNYLKKLGYGLGRLGLLALWAAPLTAALLFAWEKYSGDTDGLTVMNMIYEFGGKDMKTGVVYLLLILAALILKERITPVKILCLVLALAGTFVITSGASTQGELFGVLAVLAGVISFGTASVLMRKVTAKYPPVVVTTVSMTLSLIFNIPVAVASALTQPVHPNVAGIIALLYLGFVGSGLGQVTWTRALSILPASTCSLFYPLQPLFSALLGALLLHETFKPAFFAGLVLISLDVVLNTLETRRQAEGK